MPVPVRRAIFLEPASSSSSSSASVGISIHMADWTSILLPRQALSRGHEGCHVGWEAQDVQSSPSRCGILRVRLSLDVD